MAQQRRGFIARMLEGKERSEEYARSTLPTNRWQLFWDIFKGNFWKIVKINLLVLIFFIPVVILVFMRQILDQSNGIMYPFGANLSMGYPATPNLVGLPESIAFQSDMTTFGLIALSSFIFAIGLSGGMYVIRNMVWTEGIFVTNDFWKGVKLNYKNALQAALFFTVVLFLSMMLIDMTELALLTDTLSKFKRAMFHISRGFSVVLIVIAGMMSFWMIALGVNYKQSFFTMMRNSFLMTLGMLPQTIFFLALALLPYLLFLIGGGMLMFIALIILILFALAYTLLVWINFAQWAFDKFINPKIEGARVGRGIYNKDGSSGEDPNASAAAKEYTRAILAAGKSKLVARPIKPIDDSLQVYELPTAFTREDLQRLKDSKQNIVEDTEAYAEEHKNDFRYVEYNKQFEEREKALQDTDDKKKKRKPPKMLGQ